MEKYCDRMEELEHEHGKNIFDPKVAQQIINTLFLEGFILQRDILVILFAIGVFLQFLQIFQLQQWVPIIEQMLKDKAKQIKIHPRRPRRHTH